jgi:glycerol kinase
MRVDGGAARSDALMQLQADIFGIAIERVDQSESTALGAAFLAGLGSAVWSSPTVLAQFVKLERTFYPTMDPKDRKTLVDRWRRAVQTVIQHYSR